MLKNQQRLLSAFHIKGVEYVVVGGYAVNAHGVPRMTKALDLFIRPSEENAEAAFKALISFGAELQGMTATDLLDDESHFQMGLPPNRIDILTTISGLSFDQVWRNRIESPVHPGLQSMFISKDDLIANKLESGREQDIADVAKLRKTEMLITEAPDLSHPVDRRYQPLPEVFPNHVTDFIWKDEDRTGLQSYLHTETQGWLHIDMQGQCQDGSGSALDRETALQQALDGPSSSGLRETL